MKDQSASELRASLGHPVIDCDGHWLESPIVITEYMRDIGGTDLAERYLKAQLEPRRWYDASDRERLDKRMRRPGWWLTPQHTDDQVAFRLPALMAERLDEIGIDFMVVYPTFGLNVEETSDLDLRAAAVRAHNLMSMDLFRPFADRMTPAAIIPTATPAEAIEELTFCVRELGFKAIMLRATTERRAASGKRYVNALGLDNDEDFDPFWQACSDLGVAVTSHAGSMTWLDRNSVTNYVANHVGHFAQANHLACRSLFLGGVTRRFPSLSFAFLEGGAGWARNLLQDLGGHLEKRTYENALRHLDPRILDSERLRYLYERHATGRLRDLQDSVLASISPETRRRNFERETEHRDDFVAAGCSTVAELEAEFSRAFYFGCEADDPMTGLAFDRRYGVPLKAVFSSDITHWDTPNISGVLAEAWELVERELINPDDFRRFVFTNAVRLHTSANPDFFTGTRVEDAVRQKLLNADRL